MKSPHELYRGIVNATRAVKAGEIPKDDRNAILKKIQECESRADDKNVDDVLDRVNGKIKDPNTD